MKTQIEKNMESLWRDIESHAEQAMTTETVTRLSACLGAYKAICMVHGSEVVPATASETEGLVDGLEGDTDFDKLIMSIPADKKHMAAVLGIISDHMEGLKIINNRKYENLMMRLREVAGA